MAPASSSGAAGSSRIVRGPARGHPASEAARTRRMLRRCARASPPARWVGSDVRSTDRPTTRRRGTLAIAALVLLAVACSDDDDAAPATSSAATATSSVAAATTSATASSVPATTAPPTDGTRHDRPTDDSADRRGGRRRLLGDRADRPGLRRRTRPQRRRRWSSSTATTVIVHEEYWGDFGPDRVSLVASSSKMITAGVLLRLHDDGLLDIDAPVAAVADWGAGNPDDHPGPAGLQQLGARRPAARTRATRPYVCQFLPAGTMQDCAASIFAHPGRRRRHRGAGHRVPLRRRAVAGRRRRRRDRLRQVVGRADRRDLRAAVRASRRLAFNNHFTQFGTAGVRATRRRSPPIRRRCRPPTTRTWRAAPTSRRATTPSSC